MHKIFDRIFEKCFAYFSLIKICKNSLHLDKRFPSSIARVKIQNFVKYVSSFSTLYWQIKHCLRKGSWILCTIKMHIIFYKLYLNKQAWSSLTKIVTRQNSFHLNESYFQLANSAKFRQTFSNLHRPRFPKCCLNVHPVQ